VSYIIYYLIILDDYINRMSWAAYVARVERLGHRLTHNFFVEKRQGKKLLGRLLSRREDNINPLTPELIPPRNPA
jgi:hypothetical protein